MPKKDSPNGAEGMYIPDYTMFDFGFPKGEEASYKDSPNGVEEMYIPNYTMLDFGFPEGGTRVGGRPRSR